MSRDRSQLNPLLNIIIDAFLAKCEEQGLKVQVTDCRRTKEEQNALDPSVTQVRYPYSFHNWGLAFDICQGVKGNAYPTDIAWWNKVGKIGESLGLEWGGSWTGFVDRPHFQLNCYGDVNYMVKYYGTPEKLMKTTDWKVVVPKKPITPKSQFRKIIWFQAMLCINGFPVEIDGEWGEKTQEAYNKYLTTKLNKNCPAEVINLLVE